METTKMDELAASVVGVLLGNYPADKATQKMSELRDEVNKTAMREAGCTAGDLADEEMEESHRVLHFWNLNSYLYTKILIAAANRMSSYEGFDR
jgi:hypothetical protein